MNTKLPTPLQQTWLLTLTPPPPHPHCAIHNGMSLRDVHLSIQSTGELLKQYNYVK